MAENFTLPTETIELPSKGLVYPKDSPLSSGKIEMKYMTAKEEDILTNQNYIRQGIVFDKLLKSLIVSDIKYDDLVVGDKNAILIAARILGYGKEYTFQYPHPVTGEGEAVTVDLTTFKEKELDWSEYRNLNEFEYELPTTKNRVTFKFLTHKDEKVIDDELKGLRKINISTEITTRLKHQITSINGDREKKAINKFVDTFLLAADSRALRQHMRDMSPDLELKFTFVGSDGYTQEGVELPLGVSFFYPSNGI